MAEAAVQRFQSLKVAEDVADATTTVHFLGHVDEWRKAAQIEVVGEQVALGVHPHAAKPIEVGRDTLQHIAIPGSSYDAYRTVPK